MKNAFLMLLALTAIAFFGACEEEENNCDPGDLSVTLEGSWNVDGSPVQFNSDGRVIDITNFFWGEMPEDDLIFLFRTWEVMDTELNVETAYSMGGFVVRRNKNYAWRSALCRESAIQEIIFEDLDTGNLITFVPQ